MKDDFLDAHHRHWEDAELLFGASRWSNADHLYGIAAECGLKRLMLLFGMEMDSKTGSLKKIDREHVNRLRERYESYRCWHNLGAGYSLTLDDPFSDWAASQRYAHRDEFDQARVHKHRTGADSVRELIHKAECEGLL